MLIDSAVAAEPGEKSVRGFKPLGSEQPLAIKLVGKFPTAFPDGIKEGPAERLKEASAEGAVVLVGDSDFVQDGAAVSPGEVLLTIHGAARPVLSAERVALNFVQRLSGIATLTQRYVAAVAGTEAIVVDTRKTTPGLRTLEKYAVRAGGGQNHRTGLYDGVLIKDNHLVAAGGITAAVRAARRHGSHLLRVEVEVDTLDQAREAVEAGADVILLDNFDASGLREAVAMIAGRAMTEASGGINLTTVRAAAEAGVTLISVGALTHSAPAIDVGLDFDFVIA
ncbi:MAG: carboxylating nicotinate-nucleotide diphosphorylase [Proteobacteria bacterium]|nr:carboxylating nicotinate-nucleotide diphosphorylase [Pseudomonadota bacterium]